MNNKIVPLRAYLKILNTGNLQSTDLKPGSLVPQLFSNTKVLLIIMLQVSISQSMVLT